MIQKLLVRFVFVASLLPFVGCVHLPLKQPVRAPAPLPEFYASQLREHARPLKVVGEDVLLKKTKHYQRWLTTIESYQPHFGTNKLVEIEWVMPLGAINLPVSFLLPVSGGKKYPIERPRLGPFLAKKGNICTALVRREKKMRRLDMMDPSVYDPIIRQTVLDNKLVLDWIATRKEFDTNRIGVIGTSLGSMKGAMLVATDDRIKAAVLILSGCDAPYMLAYSKEGALRRGGMSAKRDWYLKHRGITREEFRKELESVIKWDPKYIGMCTDPRKVLLMLGASDVVVPFKKGMELRHAMGDPKTIVLPTGHYLSLLYFSYMKSKALGFLKKKFDEEQIREKSVVVAR